VPCSTAAPLPLLDRLTRMDVNRLFTARSGQQFCVDLRRGGIESRLRDLEGERQRQQAVPQRTMTRAPTGATSAPPPDASAPAAGASPD